MSTRLIPAWSVYFNTWSYKIGGAGPYLSTLGYRRMIGDFYRAYGTKPAGKTYYLSRK